MDKKQLAQFRQTLISRLAELQSSDTGTRSDRATVMLDQQSVGRLSRMDALQQQAMANALHQRRQQEMTKAKSALQRIAEGEFGYCQDCGDEISQGRLEFDPTVFCCIGCARALEQI